jgi:hypothetical protein
MNIINKGFSTVCLSILLIVLFKSTWARGPRQGTIMTEIYGGFALHESEIIVQEKQFVNDFNYYIIQYDGFGFLIDSTKLTYDFYRSFFSGLSVEYFIKENWSLALAYQYKSVTQNPDTYFESGNLSSNRIVRLDLLAPSLAYWFITRQINISFKGSLLFGRGDLTRIPVIHSLTGTYDTEEEKQLVTAYHKAVPLNVTGFALQPALYFFFRSGVSVRIGLKYEFLRVSINDTAFDYPSKTNFHELGINLALGYVHIPKK